MAGLSPFEILKAATYNPAVFLGKQEKLGTLEAGKQADLLLVEANPLQDIANLKQLKGIVLQGKWIPKDQLQTAQNTCLTNKER